MGDDRDRDGHDEPAPRHTGAHATTEDGVQDGELPRGTSLGRYSILGRIDSSPSGALYAAYDADSQRKVAIKLLRVAVTDDDPDEQQALVRLAREAQRIAKLDHPCIVQVFEVGVFRDRVFMAMEFIDGIDLRHWMEARDDPFPWPEVLRVFREAGRGLAMAHQSGVVHRNFRPANVIMGKSGRICVLNFGLSRAAFERGRDDSDISELRSSLPGDAPTGEDDASTSQTRATWGTPAYMAPEQHVSSKVDHRSDQFSFCVSLYEALYGERPFSGNRPIALALAAVNRKIRPVPEGSDVPPWLRAVVLTGLSPLPEDRFPSMDALLRELAADPKASRRRWALGGTAVVAGLAGLLGVVRLREAEKTDCAPNIQALQGIWDPSRREVLEAAVLASQRPWAAPTWSTIEDRVTAWTDVWTAGTELFCLATRSWGVADEALYDKRLQCLDRHLGELSALGRVLQSPSPFVVDHAPDIAMALRSPRLCRDDEALLRRDDPPEDLAERIAVHQSDAADIRAYLAAAQSQVALRQAIELTLAVEPLGYAPLHVEVMLLHGRALRATGDLEAAEARLHRAATLANAAGLEADAAEAYIELAAALQQGGKADEAERLGDYADALVRRLQLFHLGPTLAMVQAEVAVAQGKPSVALSKYYRSIKLENERVDAHPLRLAPMWVKLGRLLVSRGDSATATTHFTEALGILEHALGPQHPRVADALVDLAAAQRQLGHADQAVVSLQRALDVTKQLDDPEALGMAQLRLADALLATNAATQAAARFADAEAAFLQAGRPERTAEAAYGRGLAEFADGAELGAATTLARAVAYAEALDDQVALADARFALARALWHDPSQHARASSLASLAERAYGAAGPAKAESSAAVRRWRQAQATPDDQAPAQEVTP